MTESITAEQQATEFFTRHRSRTEIQALKKERYSPELLQVTREATGYKYNALVIQRRRRSQEDQRAAFARAMASPLIDDAARSMLPAPRFNGRSKRADYWQGHERAARRFFGRVDGENLYASEEAGRQGWRDRVSARRIEAAAVAILHHWATAPIDPITTAEYRAITTKHPATIRAIAKEQKDRDHRYTGRRIQPVGGMTLGRAYEIAQAALEAIQNGTAPPRISPPRGDGRCPP
ncbi:hypothetical protein ACPW96_18190 [Micromonospora sp. DT81.3]|uniref:hypothetical protein n=1 Tax=Micromonospora sp. DT81.3 TaxID=3416523 RepID=UPI003CE7789B